MRDVEEIVRAGEAGLQTWVNDGIQEDVQLEFKRKANAKNGAFETDDRRNLAKVLSGFANTGGGIAIWGIEASKGADGVDCAKKLIPIVGINAFASEARSLAMTLVMPRLEGTRIEPIPSGADAGLGYLLVGVPRSDRRPHRGEASGEKVYWKRSSDSFVAMEHYDIEDAFNRRASAHVDLKWKIIARTSGTHPNGERWEKHHVVLTLMNDSPRTARFPYLYIRDLAGASFANYGLDGNGNNGLPRIHGVEGFRFAGGADHVVHPDTELPVSALEIERRWGASGETLNGRAVEDFVLNFTYRCGSQDSQPSAGKFVLHGTQLF